MKRSVSGFINGDIDTCAVNIDSADYQWIIVIFFCQPHPTEQGHLNTIWISNGANLYFFLFYSSTRRGGTCEIAYRSSPLSEKSFAPRSFRLLLIIKIVNWRAIFFEFVNHSANLIESNEMWFAVGALIVTGDEWDSGTNLGRGESFEFFLNKNFVLWLVLLTIFTRQKTNSSCWVVWIN